MKTIRCNDCYEENSLTEEKCTRCGRSLDDSRRDQLRDKFDVQHSDAPNVIRKDAVPRKVW